jgi:hypothetical protein
MANPELDVGQNLLPIAKAIREELFRVTKYLPFRLRRVVQS